MTKPTIRLEQQQETPSARERLLAAMEHDGTADAAHDQSIALLALKAAAEAAPPVCSAESKCRECGALRSAQRAIHALAAEIRRGKP